MDRLRGTFTSSMRAELTASRDEFLGNCPVCRRLLNFWLTGEWQCPRCGGPTPDVSDKLRAANTDMR
ncbi:hypothetical protein FTUN_8994 (plasmid) [Frigoriglobus tundricola]|uniref:Uncharacterized protein n=1 Tax=Frigoriglobus tundricola TaxID=2774151 RepID=A0A6M5Z4J4_9BACT|nr:hypothetical protein FTUN_8994 [Frigoriglobus tundricola]